MAEVISAKNLTKTYGKVCAVDNLNLSVKKGKYSDF
jgi:ABC-type multidrug transport system ATPase subunit